MSPPNTRKAELLHEIFAGVADALSVGLANGAENVAQPHEAKRHARAGP